MNLLVHYEHIAIKLDLVVSPHLVFLISNAPSDTSCSFVPNLDRDFILALASSTLHHQRSALRDALFKHIACEASLRVVLPVSEKLADSLPELPHL